MANEVTVFIPEFEDALFQSFDPIRVFAKQDQLGTGAKTVQIPNSGGLTYANITSSGHTYPRDFGTRIDASQSYNLTQIEVDPFRIGRWEEFVMNADLRKSIFGEVAGLLGAFAIRTILNGFHTAGTSGKVYATTGSTTYTNRWANTGQKGLSIDDVSKIAMMMDIDQVPRDGNRYLVLDPEMWANFLISLAAIGYEDTATQAFRTGTMPEIHGFKIVMLPEVLHLSASNAAALAPGTSGANTHLNGGFAIHKNFVGWAASNVNLYVEEVSAPNYGAVVSGDFFAGGKYRRQTAVGCITIYNGE